MPILTRRAYKAISRWLPNEVLTEIIQAVPKLADQASLCRVSKLFYDLCLPVLYRVVHLDVKLHSAVTFSSSLKENSTRADAIRHLIVTHIAVHSGPPPDRGVVTKTITESLKFMRRLEHLSMYPVVWDKDHDYRPTLLQYTFPGLLSCVVAMSFMEDDPYTDLLGSFLSRHLELIRLRVVGDLVRAPSTRISLGNLQYYQGPAVLLISLDVGIGLREAQIHWSSNEIDDLENIILALKSLTRNDIPFTCCNEYWDDDVDAPQIMDLISRNIPYTKTLRLVWHDLFFTDEIVDTIRHIKECLPRFTGLVYLAVEGYRPVEDEYKNQIKVEAWGNACPTLEACSLNKRAWRKVNGVWERYSIDDFRVLSGMFWSGW
ncbi:hypothetical protein C8R44DRAFT_859384, partial [Mycena epipterygia]